MKRSDPELRAAYLEGYRHGRRLDYFVKTCPYNITSRLSRWYHNGFIQGTTKRCREANAQVKG